MNRLLPFLLALLVAHLAVGAGTNEKQVLGVELAQPDIVTDMDFAVVSVRCEPWHLWHGMFYEPPIQREISGLPPHIPTNSILKIGKEVRGFKLIAVDEKHETQVIQGHEVKIDVSELTIQHGDHVFTMTKGKKTPYEQVFVTFRGESKDSEVTVSVGETFKIMGKSFRLTSFDRKTGICTVMDEASHRVMATKPWVGK